MNHTSTATPSDADCHYPSSMSEVDSLSDSDWLDISSNRESDDNESVSSRGSDREGGSLSPSRRSSMSVGSSRDGDIEAWEGFADDSADEGIPISSSVHPVSSAADNAEPDSAGPPSATENATAEEQHVNDALDQSMVGTLNASRSSSSAGRSSSAHNSVRDLRLSFPDPLTSSRDELMKTYEDISPSETTFTGSNDEDAVSQCDVPSPNPDKNPSSFPTPEATDHQPEIQESHNCAELDVVLYGSTLATPWNFVYGLIQKEAIESDRKLIIASSSMNGSTRWLHLERSVSELTNVVDVVAIHDRTEGGLARLAETPSSDHSLDRPSLAIIFLPCSSPLSLSEHTLYLPVFVSSSPLVDSVIRYETTIRKAAQEWNSLAIPASKTMRLYGDRDSYLFNSQDLRLLQPLRVHHEFQRLAAQAKERPTKGFLRQLTSVHVMTLIALLSLTLGFAIHYVFPTPTPAPTPTTGSNTSNFWGILGHAINHSSVVPHNTANTDVAVIPLSLKELALAVLNPATSPQSSNVRPSTRCGPGITKSQDCECRLLTWSERVKSSKDLILRPGPSVISVNIPSKSRTRISSVAKIVGPKGEPSSSLNVKLIDSLSEIAQTRMKALVEVISHDVDELMDALDELASAIRRQTSAIKKQSKTNAQILRKRLQDRNDRARAKAKELRQRGEQVISFAGEQLLDRAGIAKKRAQTLRHDLVTSEAWLAYRSAHRQWVTKLNGGGRNERVKGKRGIGGERKNGPAAKLYSGV